MKKLLMSMVAAATAVVLAGNAQASLVRLDATGGGNQQVYKVGENRFLGLVGIDARGDQYDASTISADLLLNSIQQPGNVLGFYKGQGLADLLGGSEFDALSFDFAGPENAKIFSAVWIEFTGANLGLLKWNADGTASTRSGTLGVGEADLLSGNPLAPVPVPAALPMLLAGVAGLGWVARRRKTG